MIDALLAQQETCRRNRKDSEDFCLTRCRRCQRARDYRNAKEENTSVG